MDYPPQLPEQPVVSYLEFLLEGVLLTAVSIFGLVGNIVAIIVLSRPAMKGSFSTLLIGLSSFDLLYLAIGIFIFGLPAMSVGYNDHVHPYVLPVCFGFGHIGRVGSVFVTMSVTIERYFAIVHPLKHFSGKKYLLVVPIVLSVLYNIPKFFELKRDISKDGVIVTSTDLRENEVYVKYYIFWSKFILVEVIPYFTIVVLNSAIIGKIWKSNQFRRRFVTNETPTLTTSNQINGHVSMSSITGNGSGHTLLQQSQASPGTTAASVVLKNDQADMTARQRREANLGIVLVSISFLFIVCQSVKIVPDLYEVVTCRLAGNDSVTKCRSTPIIQIVIALSHFLLAVNSSVNVIIYTLRGEKFREVLTATFGLDGCRCRKRQKGSKAGNMTLLPLHRNCSEYCTQVLSTATAVGMSVTTALPASTITSINQQLSSSPTKGTSGSPTTAIGLTGQDTIVVVGEEV